MGPRLSRQSRLGGVRPMKLAMWRPDGKREMSPTKACSAVAVSRPMPWYRAEPSDGR